MVYYISDFPRENSPPLCSPTTIHAQNEFVLLHRFSIQLSRYLLQAIRLAVPARILGSVFTAVYCTAGTERCCSQGRVVSSQLLVHAGQLRLALTCLMRRAVNMHIHGFRTGAFDIAH